jgi:nucleoside-diphosphate-sugar epimerase
MRPPPPDSETVVTPPLVAITGAGGFLGRHLVEAARARGWRVRVLARSRRLPEWDDGVEVVTGSLSDAASLVDLARGADAVIHGAGLVKARNRAEFFATNRDGTLAMAAATEPGSHFILISSLAAREPHLSHYAASKAAAEEAARELIPRERLTIVRPPVIYGPHDRETLIFFRMARWPLAPVLGTGAERFAMIEVSDAAAAIATLTEKKIVGTYALSDGQPEGYSMTEIVEAASAAFGKEARMLMINPALLSWSGYIGSSLSLLSSRAIMLSPGKMREIVHGAWGLTPDEVFADPSLRPMPLREGFTRTAAWYRAARWL